jgi:hypothetical protein
MIRHKVLMRGLVSGRGVLRWNKGQPDSPWCLPAPNGLAGVGGLSTGTRATFANTAIYFSPSGLCFVITGGLEPSTGSTT